MLATHLPTDGLSKTVRAAGDDLARVSVALLSDARRHIHRVAGPLWRSHGIVAAGVMADGWQRVDDDSVLPIRNRL